MHEDDESEWEDMEIPHLDPTEGRLMTTAKKMRMEGLTIDCPACLEGMIASQPGRTRRMDPPQVCKFWDYKAGKYICPSCLGKSPSTRAKQHNGHLRDHTCRCGPGGDARSRRARIEEGKPGGKNVAGPVRDPAVPPAGIPFREISSDISRTSGDSAGSNGSSGPALG